MRAAMIGLTGASATAGPDLHAGMFPGEAGVMIAEVANGEAPGPTAGAAHDHRTSAAPGARNPANAANRSNPCPT